jgi:hypothetical protein
MVDLVNQIEQIESVAFKKLALWREKERQAQRPSPEAEQVFQAICHIQWCHNDAEVASPDQKRILLNKAATICNNMPSPAL